MRFELGMSGISPSKHTDEEIVKMYNNTITDIPTIGICRDGTHIELEITKT
jgi:hypothetical protein